MLKLIVVDDEAIIRDALSDMIDYRSLGYTLSGSARNGMEALDLIMDEDPDVVITDIRMPVLDGLSLIEQAEKKGARAQFILLSGYDDFEYARRAMKLGVRYYLLKPTDRSELEEALLAIRAEREKTAPVGAPEPEEPADDLVSRCKAYVHGHLDQESLSLKWIAEHHCFVSIGYLSKQFILHEGVRFSEYVGRLRMETAKAMFDNGETNIRTVAAAVGFGSNPQYFGQVFKKYIGCTPSDYLAGSSRGQ